MIGLLFLFVVFIVLSSGVSAMRDMAKNDICNVHKWIYKDNVMVCGICHKTPEQVISS